MKKYGILLALVSTIILAGCGNKGENMSFEDAYKQFGKQLPEIQTDMKEQGPVAGQSVTDVTMTSPEGINASGQIIFSGMYDDMSGAFNIDMSIKGRAYEPSFGSNIIIDGMLRFVNDTKNIYAFIDTFSLTPETGEADGGIITAIIGSISKKWIQLSEGNTGAVEGFSSYRKNMTSLATHLEEALEKYPLFMDAGKTTIDGHTAYKLAWNPAGVSGFVQYLLQDAQNLGQQVTFSTEKVEEVKQGILNSPLVGYLIIKDKNDVELRIDSFKTEDLGDLALSITKKGMTMKLADITDNTTIMTGTASVDGRNLVFNISMPSGQLNLVGKLSDEMKNSSIQLYTPDATISFITKSDYRKIDTFTPTLVGTSTSLSQILQGFGMLAGAGGMEEGSEMEYMDTTGAMMETTTP